MVEAQTPELFVSSTTYCEGSVGVTFGVHNTVQGVTYRLQRNNPPWQVVGSEEGNGGTIYFASRYLAGDYRLQQQQQTIITIIEISLPEQIFNVTGGGGFCSNTDDYPSIGLDGSQPQASGVSYELFRDGESVEKLQGTGSELNFGPFNIPGEYVVEAERQGCYRPMVGSVEVEVFLPPDVSFDFSELGPPVSCGTVLFTSTVNGELNPVGYSYEWFFGEEEPGDSVPDPTYIFPAYGVGFEEYIVNLVVTDNNGCISTFENRVVVNERPFIKLVPNLGLWHKCDADPDAQFLLTVFNEDTITADTNIEYLINWGDGTDPLQLTAEQFPFGGSVSHNYESKGAFLLTISAFGPNCASSKVYPVFNGSTPAGGITYQQGSLEGCIPHAITFRLSGEAADNPPATEYYFNFGDGTPPLIFTQENMPDLDPAGYFPIIHIYESSSCFLEGSAFAMDSYVMNPCATIPNDVGGIKVSEKAVADFLRFEFPVDPVLVCVNQPKMFISNATDGCIIYGSQVIEVTSHFWDFFNNGIIDSEEENPTFTFSEPGLFPVKLGALTGEGLPNCGTDEIVRDVCVQDIPEPSFIITESVVCVNEIITPLNTSIVGPDCAVPHYEWIISPSSGVEYAGGTNASSYQPNIKFTQSGEYIITLKISHYSGASHCIQEFSEPFIVLVQGLPIIEIHEEVALCDEWTLDITDAIITYQENYSEIISYQWTASPPGVIFSDENYPFPSLMVIDEVGQEFELTVAVEGGCGIIESEPLVVSFFEGIGNNNIYFEGELVLCNEGSLGAEILGTEPPELMGGDETFEYAWYINTGVGWTLIDDETNSYLFYEEPLFSNPTIFKRRVFSAACVSDSEPLYFEVLPQIENNIIQNIESQHICALNQPEELIGSEASGGQGEAFIYQWFESVDDGETWFPADDTNGNDGINYMPPLLDQTTWYRRKVVSGACIDISDPVIVHVYGDVENNNILYGGGEICYGDTAATIEGTVPEQSGNDSFHYQWQKSIDGDIFVNIAGANDIHYSPDVLEQTSIFRRVVTSQGNVPDACNIHVSNTIEIIVNNNPTAFAGNDEVVFHGGQVTLSGSAEGGSGSYSYYWEPAEMVLNGQGTPSITSINLFPPPSSVEFCLTVTDNTTGCNHTDCLDVIIGDDALSCLIVNDSPEYCFGDLVELSALVSGGSGQFTDYIWTLPEGTNYMGETLIHTPVSLGENIYELSVSDGANTANCQIELWVNDLPLISSATEKMICSGEQVAYQAASVNVPDASYMWTAEDNPFISGITNSGNGMINDVLINNSSVIQEAVYTIFPFGPGPTFCEGEAFELVVSVNPIPQTTTIDGTTSQMVISGQSSSLIEFTSDVNHSNVIYYWSSATDCPEDAISYEYLNGSGSVIPAQTISIDEEGPAVCLITYTIYAQIHGCPGPEFSYQIVVNLAPSSFNVGGGGIFCSGGSTQVTLDGSEQGVSYQLLRNGIPIMASQSGTGSPLLWTGISKGGIYRVKATNLNSGATEMMGGMAEAIVRQLPDRFNLYVQEPGDHCLPLAPWLNGSQHNVLYQLEYTPDGFGESLFVQEITGTGNSLLFDQEHDPGIYQVIAYLDHGDIVCSQYMHGSIEAKTLPQEFQISPDGLICEDLEEICLVSSEIGIVYQLWINYQPVPGTAITGTGGEVCFGTLEAPGIYSIHAKNPETLCETFFNKTITVEASPLIFTMHPSTSCQGADIFISGCETGIHYYLYLEPEADKREFIMVDGPLTCNGSNEINFGPQFDVGTYRIKAVNPDTNCAVWMDQTTVIYSQPEVFEMSPQGLGCPPVEFFMENSQAEVTYFLFRNDEMVAMAHGSQGVVFFDEQSAPGIYTVKASYEHADGILCWKNMSGSYEIKPQPNPYSLKPNVPVCKPAELFLNGSEEDVIYQLWNDVSGFQSQLEGNGGILFFEPVNQHGNYWVVGVKNNCEANMTGTSVVLPSPVAYNIYPGDGLWCLDDNIEIGLVDSDSAVIYELYREHSTLNPLETYVSSGGHFTFSFPVTQFGKYKVKAVSPDTYCSRWMNGEIIVNRQPHLYYISADDITGGGLYCPGITIGLSGSEEGVNYYLRLPGDATDVKEGSGAPISFGTYWIPGEYSIYAINPQTSCTREMGDTIGLFEAPEVFNLYAVPGPDYCAGDNDAIELVLNYSEIGSVYQLYKNNDNQPVFSPQQGTGQSISWNSISQFGPGNYYVKAHFISDPGCFGLMDGVIAVGEVAYPVIHAIAGGIICENDVFELFATASHYDPGSIFWEVVSGPGIVSPSNSLQTTFIPGQVDEITYSHLRINVNGIGPCTSQTAKENIIVELHPLPYANAGTDGSVCESMPFFLSDAIVQHHSSFLWSIHEGAGLIADPTSITTVFYPDPVDELTEIVLKLEAWGHNYCAYASDTSYITITVTPMPLANAGTGVSGCVADLYVLNDATASHYSEVLWEVVSGKGSIVSSTYVNAGYQPHEDDAGSNVVLRLTAYGKSDCIQHQAESLIVFYLEPLPQVFSGYDMVTCFHNPAQVMFAWTNYESSYFWSHNGNGFFNDPNIINPTYTPGPGDENTIVVLTLQANGFGNCDNYDVVSSSALFVQPPPAVFLNEEEVVTCVDVPVLLPGASVEHTAQTMWSIVEGQGTIYNPASLTLASYNPDLADVGNIVVLALTAFGDGSCDGFTAEAYLYLIVDSLPSINAGEDGVVCVNGYFELSASAEHYDPATVSWEVVYGLGVVSPTNSLNAVFIPEVAAELQVVVLRLAVQGAGGCVESEMTSDLTIEVTPLPLVYAGGMGFVCEGDTYSLNNANAEFSDHVQWTVLSGSGELLNPDSLNSQYVASAYDAGNEVILLLSAFGQGPCGHFYEQDEFILSVVPLPELNAGNSLATCVQDMIQIPDHHVTLENHQHVEWTVKNNHGFGYLMNPFTLTPTYVPHPADAGKTVVLEIIAYGENACGDFSVVDELQIHIASKPVPWFKLDHSQPPCEGNEVFFIDQTGYGSSAPHDLQYINRRIWQFEEDQPPIEVFDDDPVSHVFSEAGTYFVQLTIETMIGNDLVCIVSIEKQVKIHPNPIADFEHHQLDHCSYKVQFEDQSTAFQTTINNWLWNFGGGHYSDAYNPFFIYETHGEKETSLIVIDNRGCIGEKTKTFHLKPAFDFEIGYNNFCFGEETVIYVEEGSLVPPENSIIHFTWTFSHSDIILNTPIAKHLYDQPGKYQVSLKALDITGCIREKTTSIHVPQALNPYFTFQDCASFVVFNPYETSDFEIVRWSWDFGDGNVENFFGTHPSSISHQYDKEGYYMVSLEVECENGCIGEYSAIIRTTCVEYLQFFVPTAFAPDDHKNYEFNVFMPKGENIQAYHIQVFDLTGNVVWESDKVEDGHPVEWWDGTHHISGSPLPQGAYVWKAHVKFIDGTVWKSDKKTGKNTGIVTIIR